MESYSLVVDAGLCSGLDYEGTLCLEQIVLTNLQYLNNYEKSTFSDEMDRKLEKETSAPQYE